MPEETILNHEKRYSYVPPARVKSKIKEIGDHFQYDHKSTVITNCVKVAHELFKEDDALFTKYLRN